jgi:hypothetical protein
MLGMMVLAMAPMVALMALQAPHQLHSWLAAKRSEHALSP